MLTRQAHKRLPSLLQTMLHTSCSLQMNNLSSYATANSSSSFDQPHVILNAASAAAGTCVTGNRYRHLIFPSLQHVRNITLAANPLEPVAMLCYQCEQTRGGQGCVTIGVCGKTPEVSSLQDLLMYSLKGLASWADHARKLAGIEDDEVNSFINAATFSTLTNVNFNDVRFQEYIHRAQDYLKRMKTKVIEAGLPPLEVPPNVPWFSSGVPNPIAWELPLQDANDMEKLLDYGHQIGILERRQRMGDNDTLLGLHELLTYGLKGAAAYMHHAEMLGQRDNEVYAQFQEYLRFLCSPEANDAMAVLQKCLDLGKTNLRVMQLLEEGHIKQMGQPTPSKVRTTPKKGKAILITGHDMPDLKALLEQTEGSGVNVYTHGEMLPGHAYPELRKYPHLVGNWGGAWYKQKKEFPKFPGAILATTNCILDPLESYRPNLFTTGDTGLNSVHHIVGKDFTPVIERAKELPGFLEDGPDDAPELTVGYHKDILLGAAPAVLDAVAKQQLKHIFVVGGCDGSEPQRKYYSRLSEHMPKETMVLTMGCAKYRLLDQEWGQVPGTDLPRLADVGQCNDSYGAIQVAIALAQALKTDVNSLPLSLDISWFEQKAVAVLLSLLHLGVKNIRLGPRLPAFITPEALQILVETYQLKPADVKNPEADVESMLCRV